MRRAGAVARRRLRAGETVVVIEVARTARPSTLRRDVRVDVADLAPVERARLIALVNRLNLDELETESPMQGSRPDRFQYEITFKEEGKDWHVVVDESRLLGELRDLIELLLNG